MHIAHGHDTLIKQSSQIVTYYLCVRFNQTYNVVFYRISNDAIANPTVSPPAALSYDAAVISVTIIIIVYGAHTRHTKVAAVQVNPREQHRHGKQVVSETSRHYENKEQCTVAITHAISKKKKKCYILHIRHYNIIYIRRSTCAPYLPIL